MTMSVDESRNDGGTSNIDALRSFGHWHRCCRADRGNFAVPDDDGRTVDHAAFAIDDTRANEGCRLTRHDTWRDQHGKSKDSAWDGSGPGRQGLRHAAQASTKLTAGGIACAMIDG